MDFNYEDALVSVHFHKIQLSHKQEVLKKRLLRVSLLSGHNYHYHNCYYYHHHHYDHYGDYDFHHHHYH